MRYTHPHINSAGAPDKEPFERTRPHRQTLGAQLTRAQPAKMDFLAAGDGAAITIKLIDSAQLADVLVVAILLYRPSKIGLFAKKYLYLLRRRPLKVNLFKLFNC